MDKTERLKISAYYIVPLLLVLVIQCCFVARKEGYHMDELLSFELSNAEYNPWIVPTQPVGRLAKFIHEEIEGETFQETLSNLADTVADVLNNRGSSKILQYKADVYEEPVWITAEQFEQYLTVNEKDSFNYFSVYFNVNDDNHPPLHFMLLHTVSSLFKNKINPFIGCIINIGAILGCCLLFLSMGAFLEEKTLLPENTGRLYGICSCILYGVSSGAVATALLIRMYGVLTFFCTALFYIHVKKYFGDGFEKKNRLLIIITVLGFLTQYFFLFYCFGLAIVTVALLIKNGRIKELKKYICSMLVSAMIGVLVYPFSISDVFSSGRGVEALGNLRSGFGDYGYRLFTFGSILLKGCFGRPIYGIVVILILAIVLSIALFLRNKKNTCEKKTERNTFLLLLIIPVILYFLLAAKTSPYLVDRYIMPLFPFSALILTQLLSTVCLQTGKTGRYLILVPVILTGIINVAAYDGEYLYKGYKDQLAIAEEYKDLSCICLYDGYGYYYNLLEFTEYGETLLLKLPELEQRQDTSALTRTDKIVVLRKSEVDEENTLKALRLYGWEVEDILISPEDSVYGDTVYLCVRNAEYQDH